MGLEVLQGDIIVNSPRYPRPSKGMEAINSRIQLEGNQEAGEGGTDHGGLILGGPLHGLGPFHYDGGPWGTKNDVTTYKMTGRIK